MIGFDDAALPHMADFGNPGTGLTASSQTNDVVLSAENQSNSDGGSIVAPSLHGTVGGEPVAWWLTLIVLFIGIKFIAERGGDGSQFANVKIGFWNMLTITFAAIIGITFLKWVFGIYKVPGLSPVIEAV